jgi:hypothetical protein
MAASKRQESTRRWLPALAFAATALLHAATWAGLGLGAFVPWDAIHAFYFQQSYGAGLLPLAMAALLLAAGLCLLFRWEAWARLPAFGAMILSFVLLPRMGNASLLSPFIHPMQLIHWGAMALTWGGCIWLFILGNRERRGHA